MYDDYFSEIINVVLRLCSFLFLVIVLISVIDHDNSSYTDYEITDCRYFIKVSGYNRAREQIDVFYENTKVTISVSSIKIDDASFVRVYDDVLGIVEVHMTKDDYMYYTN